MSRQGAARLDRRVLVLAPTSRDATITADLLAAAGIALDVCPSFDALLDELARGAAAILFPEEALRPEPLANLSGVLARQPAWSDLPVLILARPGANSLESADAVRTLGNVTLLERPLRVATFLSAVRTALRARERQFQIRGYLRERARAEESLRLADWRKDEFLATLGHELRNPLAPLLSGLQLLKTSNVDNPHVLHVAAVMERQVKHLVRLVDDLLEVSRITRGLIDIQHEPLDLAAVVRAAVETSRPGLEAAGHQLVVEIPLEPITVEGDAVRLTQVFTNLLTNAARYTNAGGHIGVRVKREAKSAVVSVSDDGIGIQPEHLRSVFDMFMQVDRSSRRSQGGLGIGLTLVRSLAQMHGGRAQAYSEGPGKGSEFVVELPLMEESVAYTEPADCVQPLPPRRILIVDDNRDAADTLGALLSVLGATVAVVNSGAEAIRQVESFEPDAVLLDIGMPGMNGYDVARAIRHLPLGATVLLIALTGWGQDQDYHQSREAGFDHHLVKPPDIDRLRTLLTAQWPSPAEESAALVERPKGTAPSHPGK